MRYSRMLAILCCVSIALVMSNAEEKQPVPTTVNTSYPAPEVREDIVFPPGFIFGAATSAYQTEGGNTNADWRYWQEKQKGAPLTPEEMRSADHYNRFKEDFDLAQKIGLGSVRFSIEWARIEPTCGKFDKHAMRHYEDVVRALRERGITPFVNLNHFSIPQCYAERGGWADPLLPEHFGRYAAYVAKHLKGVEWWMTFNEPMVVVLEGYYKGGYPPGEKDSAKAMRVTLNMIEAHRRAYRALHAAAAKRREHVMVGMASFTPLFLPDTDTPDDRRIADLFTMGEQFFDTAAGDETDYVGINYYTRYFLRFSPQSPFFFAQYMRVDQGPGEKNELGWEIYPHGIYELIRKFRAFKKPILVTENGLPDAKDEQRARFILEHLYWVHKAIEEGADVRGYFAWSLTDTYEWNRGFGPRFGLIDVDFDHNLTRTIRPSAFVFGEVSRTKTITPELWRNTFEKK